MILKFKNIQSILGNVVQKVNSVNNNNNDVYTFARLPMMKNIVYISGKSDAIIQVRSIQFSF